MARSGVLPAQRIAGRWVYADEAYDILEGMLSGDQGAVYEEVFEVVTNPEDEDDDDEDDEDDDEDDDQ